MPLFITYTNNVNSSILIATVSVQEAPGTVDPTFTDLIDGQVICDLYEEETIPLTLSVDNFANVAEKPQSYSKDFDLPNTKRNNKIFTHIFEVTKVINTTYDFNPYAKTRAILKEDGVVIFDGFLRLIEIKDQQGEISYNVNLFSQPISFADTLKDKKLSNLDFSELEHTYNRTNITASFNTNGLVLTNPLPANTFAGTVGSTNTDVLKYPFVNWVGDILLADNPGSPTGPTDNLPQLESLGQVFRPFIKVKYILDNIFNDAGFEYTSTFLETAEFNNLFMDFNWGAENTPSVAAGLNWTAFGPTTDVAIGTSLTALQLRDTALTQTLPSQYNSSTYRFDITNNGVHFTCNYQIWITATAGNSGDIDVQWTVRDTASPSTIITTHEATTVTVLTLGGAVAWTGSFTAILQAGQSIGPEAVASNATHFIQKDENAVGAQQSDLDGIISSDSVTNATLLQSARGQLGQYEFFKGIMNMFNLITMPDPNDTNNIFIEPYPDVFGETPTAVTPATLNWTNKVDYQEISLKPLDYKKQIVLQYLEDENDYRASVYKFNTFNPNFSGQYGSKEINTNGLLGITGGMTTLLEGKEEVIASPFAATLCSALRADMLPDLIVPQIYQASANGTDSSSFDNAPRILYNLGKKTINNGLTYYIPEAFGVTSTNQPDFLQFSHVTEIDASLQTPNTANDYNFGATPTLWSNLSQNTLYALYYREYFNQLYNVNTKMMTLKVKLYASDINTFRFFDKVRIKNREYRVNKIDYKPDSLSIVEFILIS